MNVVQKMNLIRVEKVNLKNTEVPKKNLFVVLGHFIKYFTTLLEWSEGAEFEPLLFLEWSDRAERNSIFGAERKKEPTSK